MNRSKATYPACPGCGCAEFELHKADCPVRMAEKWQRLRAWPPTGETATILADKGAPLPDVSFRSCTPEEEREARLGRNPLLDDTVFKTADDPVSHPSHYTAFPLEVIEIIKRALGPEGFKAYCFGNEIKYRMRAGLKGDDKAAEDIGKAMTYKQLREEAK